MDDESEEGSFTEPISLLGAPAGRSKRKQPDKPREAVAPSALGLAGSGGASGVRGYLSAAERVQLERTAGPFAPPRWSQPIILGSIQTYSSSCARRRAARPRRASR